jgi:hypothetical protein
MPKSRYIKNTKLKKYKITKTQTRKKPEFEKYQLWYLATERREKCK